jgi:hypothetical protein
MPAAHDDFCPGAAHWYSSTVGALHKSAAFQIKETQQGNTIQLGDGERAA